MEFNGDDIITITLKMWELNKAELASDYLFIDKSNLSRKEPFRYNSAEFYDKVFNLCNEKSLAYKERLKYGYSNAEDLLETLKEVITALAYKDVLKDLWDKEYKEFVMSMLKRANLQPPRKKNLSSIQQSKNAEEQMMTMFEHNVLQWNIIQTINQLKDDSFNIGAEEIFINFKTAIESEMEKNFKEHKNELIYNKIIEFTHVLFDYLKWLKPRDENSMFAAYSSYWQKSDYIPKRLGILYREICGGSLFQ